MLRTQIQLREDQSERLQHLARDMGVSMAELIRQSIDRFLDARVVPCSALPRTEALRVVGWSASGRADVSERHDRYLEDAYLPPDGRRPGA